MALTVSDAIRKQTQCPHDFSCLTTGQCGNHKMCPVQYAVGPNILFLKGDDFPECSYRLPFGHHQVCRCPTRYAIHQTHGI